MRSIDTGGSRCDAGFHHGLLVQAADTQARVGLCYGCRYARVVTARADNRYWRCERAVVDPRFPKYPCLPMLACDGYEPAPQPITPAARKRA